MKENNSNLQNNNEACKCDCHSKEQSLSKKQSYLVLLVIILIGGVYLYFKDLKNKNIEKFSQEYFIMGTVLQCDVFADDNKDAIVAQKNVINAMNEVVNQCNLFDKNSELSKLNQTAHIKPFKCSDELWQIIEKSMFAYEESKGSFDITAKPLMDLWGFYKKQDKLPTQDEINAKLEVVGLNKVIFNNEEKSVYFPIKGLSFDLGGIAKGWAIDQAINELDKLQIDGGLINLGGNLKPYGKVNERSLLKIGIRDPIEKEKVCATIDIANQAVSTSGNYERFVTINGKKYAHIMNPKTGLPVENMLSVTVVCDKAVDSDIYSTSIFINGIEYAKELVKKHPEMKIYIFSLDNDKNLKYTEI